MARTAGPARGFVADLLKANPSATAAEAVAAAKAKGIKLSAPYYYVLRSSLGATRKGTARKGTPGTRRTSRSTNQSGKGASVMEQITQQLQESANYRAALEQIGKILNTTL